MSARPHLRLHEDFVAAVSLDRLAATANAAHVVGCREFCRQAIIAGQALLDAKKIVKGAGGSWSVWLRENVKFSERTAQVYMQVARDPQRAADSLRQALHQALGDKGHADPVAESDQACDPVCANLRFPSFGALFASGITPDAVITEPPTSTEHFSQLALACAAVPYVAVRMDQSCLLLPEVLPQLCAHLRYRGVLNRDNRVILTFCPDDDVFAAACARGRAIPRPTTARPYLPWDEFLIRRFTDPGGLVCDPFMRDAETARVAHESGRRFVGASLDAAVYRRPIGAAQ